MPKTDFLEIRSEKAIPVLDSIIIKLENDFEEFLRREVIFVQQCYKSGKDVWWRKYLHLGWFIPNEDILRKCILENKQPSWWYCLNRRIIPIASKHFFGRVKILNDDKAYTEHLLQQCASKPVIEVYSGFVSRFPVLKQ